MLDLINAIAGSLTTDPELGSIDGIKNIAMNLQDLRPSNIRFITAPNAPDPDNTANVKLTSEAQELWDALRADKQWPTPPDNGPDGKPLTVSPEGLKIAVLNGTSTPGLAGKKAPRRITPQISSAKTPQCGQLNSVPTKHALSRLLLGLAKCESSRNKPRLIQVWLSWWAHNSPTHVS